MFLKELRKISRTKCFYDTEKNFMICYVCTRNGITIYVFGTKQLNKTATHLVWERTNRNSKQMWIYRYISASMRNSSIWNGFILCIVAQQKSAIEILIFFYQFHFIAILLNTGIPVVIYWLGIKKIQFLVSSLLILLCCSQSILKNFIVL